MTQEEKKLLLADLCARLPYGVKVEIISYGQESLKPWFGKLSCKDLDCFIHDVAYKNIKPYLRPMSSMTKEEKEKEGKLWNIVTTTRNDLHYLYTDFLVSHHLDYRGLIPIGLALPATENMYNI